MVCSTECISWLRIAKDCCDLHLPAFQMQIQQTLLRKIATVQV